MGTKLRKLEIFKVGDLLYHFPFRYQDLRQIILISNLTSGKTQTIRGNVWQVKNRFSKGKRIITRAIIADESGQVDAIWFSQPYLSQVLKPHISYLFSGMVKTYQGKLVILSPSFEEESTQPLHLGRLVPIYPQTPRVTSRWLRSKIAWILGNLGSEIPDFLPQKVREGVGLLPLGKALHQIHFPQNEEEAEKGRRRLAFDELFLIQTATALRKKEWQETKKAPKMKAGSEEVKKFIKNLPFILTEAQKRATAEILADMQRDTPANRLLEGDVGSGKTVVAAIAAYFSFLNGFDTLVAAPTEILAFQHHKTLERTLAPYGITVGIWTGSKKNNGHVTCGTHALLTTFKPKRQLGLVVVDEQHRFGVAQRAKLFLNQERKLTPHLLTMTATPIPRTLALTLYGDLDLSILDERPKGRQKLATFVVPNHKRDGAYKFIEKQIDQGRQAFIITPFVEPSETITTVRAARDEFEKLRPIFAKRVRLGLLHGRLNSREKEATLNKFQENSINILVTTPVVEVGIDVPNATVMMIESAERFGLAQLHQLRGRVGRGEYKSYCFLFTDSWAKNSLKRLRSMEKINIGFELAEIDLQMRGPGEILGLKQSGFADLKLADLNDREMIALTQKEAQKLIKEDRSLGAYPLLIQKISQGYPAYVLPN